MVKKINKISIDSIFISIIILLSPFFEGYKNEFTFLFFSLISITFFIYKKIGIKTDNIWFIFFISLFISSIFSKAPIISFFTAFKWFIFYLFYEYAKKENIEEYFLFSILLISFISSVAMFISNFYFNNIFTGLIGKNKNYTSVLFVISTIYFIFRIFKYNIILNFIGMFYFLFSTYLINSRGAILALILTTLLILWSNNKKKEFYYLLFIITIIFIILPLNIMENLLKINDYKSYMRIKIWDTAIKGFIKYPIFGYGPGLFENIFSIFKFRFFDEISYFNHTTIHAHSEILNIVSESGIIAIVIYLIACFKTFIKSDKENIFKFFSIAIFIQSAIDIILYLPLISIVFIISISLADKKESNYMDKSLLNNQKLSLINYSIFAIVLFSIYPYFSYKLNTKKILNNNILTHKIFENNKIESTLLKEEVNISAPNSARIKAISSFANLYYPYDIFFLFERAKCEKIAGNYEEAKQILKKALKIEPFFNKATLMLSEIYLIENNKEKAEKMLNKVKNISEYNKIKIDNFYNIYIIDFDLDYYKTLKNKLSK